MARIVVARAVSANGTMVPGGRTWGGGVGKIRILALDGGGSGAGILARALGEIYGPHTPGRDIVRHFHYVAGNSGGAIVLTALCCDYTPAEVVALYDDPATVRRLFCPRWIARVPLLRKVLPRYSSTGKFEALKAQFDRKAKPGEPRPSTIRIADWPKILGAPVNLIVTAFDYDRRRTAFFRSNDASLAKSSAPSVDATLAQAVHASTNAPIRYFDRPAAFAGRRYWDGVMGGYNNPVLAAVIEALANEPERVADFRVLSIGTGTSVQPLTTERVAPPLGAQPPGERWCDALAIAATVIADDPPDAALFHAHLALRQPLPPAGSCDSHGTLVRLSPVARPLWDGAAWKLPECLDARDFAAFARMDLDAMSREELDCIRRIGDLWIAGALPNQPIRMGERFRCDIGHERFPDAVRHWHAISS